jgi:hypothetical protein
VASLNPQPLPPSPEWARAMPSGPVPNTKITAEYAALVARDAYFWAWPLVNVYNRRLASAQVPQIVKAGPVVSAPLNQLGMITDYVDPAERIVACPNQDVVYGSGSLALDQAPVVIQAPDFGDRFWVYQIVDLRTDGFASLGAMYASTPGFYLLAGPTWQGEVPAGITRVFRASTSSGFVAPRVFMDDTTEDGQAIQSVLRQIVMYPLSDYDGTMQSKDWRNLPTAPSSSGGDEETKWVDPAKFVDELRDVLADAPPLPGEEARYAEVLAVVDAAMSDPAVKDAMTRAASDAETQLVTPLFQFRSFGLQLPHHWSTIDNGAAFGTDYFTRTAVAKSNIFVNTPEAARYFYQDLDADGGRLNGERHYTVTFPKGGTPPGYGLWSLTLYNEHHFFAPNDLKRYSLGSKNKDLVVAGDGSLTLYVQADPPPADQRANWLPAPKDADFSLFLRAYWPRVASTDGSWTPPAVRRVS